MAALALDSNLIENAKLLLNIQQRQSKLEQLSKYLSELESQLALIFSASPDIIVFLDSEANIIKISDAVKTVLGYSRKEMIGKSIWDFFVNEQEKELTKKHFQQLLKDRGMYVFKRTPLVTEWIAKNNDRIRLVWRFAIHDNRENQTIGIASKVA